MAYPLDLVGKFIAWTMPHQPMMTPTEEKQMRANDGILEGQTAPPKGVTVYADPLAAPTAPATFKAELKMQYDTRSATEKAAAEKKKSKSKTPAVPTPASLPPVVAPPVNRGPLNVVATSLPWSFTFLKYKEGAVTTAPLTGAVLTGPMTGCYLCRYSKSGQHEIAHIGTVESPTDDRTIEVKAAWGNLVNRGDVNAVFGGSPFDYFDSREIAGYTFSLGDTGIILGHFEDDEAYALLLVTVPQSMKPPATPFFKVAAVKPMTLQPWVSLAAMRRFRS
jgi:hypothetical protein